MEPLVLIPSSASAPGAGGPVGKALGPTALAVACALTAALAAQRLTSPNPGYHLAYGQTSLATGRVVDHNAFIYTLPPARICRWRSGRSPTSSGLGRGGEGRFLRDIPDSCQGAK